MSPPRHLLLLALVLALVGVALPTSAAARLHDAAPPMPPPDPASKLFSRMCGLVVPHGYPCEEHFVETVDGYVLRLFRIPHGRAVTQQEQQPAPTPQAHRLSRVLQWGFRLPFQQQQQQAAAGPASGPAAAAAAAARPVVHCQHGLLGSSTDFVLNGPASSLPLMLADAGFDVWLGNVRGNVFSRNHTALDVLDAEFWQFSWDEMAARDLPAMLTHELMATGVPSLAYVGHSQGTTIGMAFLASHAGSALAERINVAVLLAPVAFVTRMSSVAMNSLAKLQTDEVFTLLGWHEFLPSSEVVSKLEGRVCQAQPYLCVNLLSLICGYNPDNLDSERLPIYLNYTPSGTSVKNMAKWAQAVRQERPDVLTAFDYGTTCRTLLDLPRPCNQVVYGQEAPPAYDLTAIRTPLVAFTGGMDILADPVDTDTLLWQLGDMVVERHHEPDYGHLDFVWGFNAGERVYAKVVRLLQPAQPGPTTAVA